MEGDHSVTQWWEGDHSVTGDYSATQRWKGDHSVTGDHSATQWWEDNHSVTQRSKGDHSVTGDHSAPQWRQGDHSVTQWWEGDHSVTQCWEGDHSVTQWEEGDHSVTQLINGDGEFNAAGLDDFVKKVKLDKCGVDYAVVSIMGPQSSVSFSSSDPLDFGRLLQALLSMPAGTYKVVERGRINLNESLEEERAIDGRNPQIGKSTLLNHLFNTKFKEMNALIGRNQTTKRVWLAECVGIRPSTIVMDLEGNDGQERSQDTAFEKQAALFALAISDILLINMRSSDIGRENAANKPLLRTIFQVLLQSLQGVRQTTLMFVLRDLEKTPLRRLRISLMNDVRKIWDDVPKPPKRTLIRFEDTFRVDVVGLPHYDYQKERFKEEVARLRGRFFNSIYPGGVACGGRETAVPASEFSFSSQQMWKVIKDNQNLNLPNHMVMISNVRCEEIANNKLDKLRQNEYWLYLRRNVETVPVQYFGRKLSSIIATYLSEYDEEVQYFDKKVRKTKRKEVLLRKALDEFHPAYEIMLEHLRCKEFDNFKAKMEQANTNKKDELFHSVYTHTEAAISEFDKGSKENLVVIPTNKYHGTLEKLANLNPFQRGRSK